MALGCGSRAWKSGWLNELLKTVTQTVPSNSIYIPSHTPETETVVVVLRLMFSIKTGARFPDWAMLETEEDQSQPIRGQYLRIPSQSNPDYILSVMTSHQRASSCDNNVLAKSKQKHHRSIALVVINFLAITSTIARQDLF